MTNNCGCENRRNRCYRGNDRGFDREGYWNQDRRCGCGYYNPEEVARAAEFVARATREFAEGDFRERMHESNCARQMMRCMRRGCGCGWE